MKYPPHSNWKRRLFSTSTLRLPIVDLSLSEERLVGQALHQACTTHGFFYAVNHGVPSALCRSILREAREFFAAPSVHKESISAEKSDTFRGYQRLKVNRTQGRQDLHEGFDLFSESTRGKVPGKPSNHGVNQWPDPTVFPEFRTTVETYSGHMQRVGHKLMRACALGLELDPTYFEPYFHDPFWNMRLVHYPAVDTTQMAADSKVELGVGEHTDYGIFTMILAEPCPNTLQVRSGANRQEWVFVESIPDAFVCNVADMLATWTNGIYRSTPHRVLPPSPQQHPEGRVSVPFFYDPSYDAMVQPIDDLVERYGIPASFAPVGYGDHLYAKTSRNFVFQE